MALQLELVANGNSIIYTYNIQCIEIQAKRKELNIKKKKLLETKFYGYWLLLLLFLLCFSIDLDRNGFEEQI